MVDKVSVHHWVAILRRTQGFARTGWATDGTPTLFGDLRKRRRSFRPFL